MDTMRVNLIDTGSRKRPDLPKTASAEAVLRSFRRTVAVIAALAACVVIPRLHPLDFNTTKAPVKAQAPQAAAAPVGLVLDPVCQRAVDPTTSKFVAKVGANPIYFDGLACLMAFQADPLRYAKVRGVHVSINPTAVPDEPAAKPVAKAPAAPPPVADPEPPPPPADAPVAADPPAPTQPSAPADEPRVIADPNSQPLPPLIPMPQHAAPGAAPQAAPPPPPPSEGPTVDADAPSVEEKPPFAPPVNAPGFKVKR